MIPYPTLGDLIPHHPETVEQKPRAEGSQLISVLSVHTCLPLQYSTVQGSVQGLYITDPAVVKASQYNKGENNYKLKKKHFIILT